MKSWAPVWPTAFTWVSGSHWQSRDMLRVPVSNWSTTDDDDVARGVDTVRWAAAAP